MATGESAPRGAEKKDAAAAAEIVREALGKYTDQQINDAIRELADEGNTVFEGLCSDDVFDMDDNNYFSMAQVLDKIDHDAASDVIERANEAFDGNDPASGEPTGGEPTSSGESSGGGSAERGEREKKREKKIGGKVIAVAAAVVMGVSAIGLGISRVLGHDKGATNIMSAAIDHRDTPTPSKAGDLESESDSESDSDSDSEKEATNESRESLRRGDYTFYNNFSEKLTNKSWCSDGDVLETAINNGDVDVVVDKDGNIKLADLQEASAVSNEYLFETEEEIAAASVAMINEASKGAYFSDLTGSTVDNFTTPTIQKMESAVEGLSDEDREKLNEEFRALNETGALEYSYEAVEGNVTNCYIENKNGSGVAVESSDEAYGVVCRTYENRIMRKVTVNVKNPETGKMEEVGHFYQKTDLTSAKITKGADGKYKVDMSTLGCAQIIIPDEYKDIIPGLPEVPPEDGDTPPVAPPDDETPPPVTPPDDETPPEKEVKTPVDEEQVDDGLDGTHVDETEVTNEATDEVPEVATYDTDTHTGKEEEKDDEGAKPTEVETADEYGGMNGEKTADDVNRTEEDAKEQQEYDEGVRAQEEADKAAEEQSDQANENAQKTNEELANLPW